MQAKICGRSNIVKDDIRCIFFPRLRFSDLFTRKQYFLFRDMTELFMDAKSSATMLRENSAKYMLWSRPELFFIITAHLRCLPLINLATEHLFLVTLLSTGGVGFQEIALGLLCHYYTHSPARCGRRHHHVQYALPNGEVQTQISSIMYCITPVGSSE